MEESPERQKGTVLNRWQGSPGELCPTRGSEEETAVAPTESCYYSPSGRQIISKWAYFRFLER